MTPIVKAGKWLRRVVRWLNEAQQDMPPAEVTAVLLFATVAAVWAIAAFVYTYPVITAVCASIVVLIRVVWKAGA